MGVAPPFSYINYLCLTPPSLPFSLPPSPSLISGYLYVTCACIYMYMSLSLHPSSQGCMGMHMPYMFMCLYSLSAIGSGIPLLFSVLTTISLCLHYVTTLYVCICTCTCTGTAGLSGPTMTGFSMYIINLLLRYTISGKIWRALNLAKYRFKIGGIYWCCT